MHGTGAFDLMLELGYTLVYFVESLISIFYFDKKYERKLGNKKLIFLVFVTAFISFLLGHLDIPIINLLLFVLSNLTIIFIGYSANKKSSIFSVAMLFVLMTATECIVMIVLKVLFGKDIFDAYESSTNYILYTILGKLLYFLSVYFTAKLSAKEHSTNDKTLWSLLMCTFPLGSVLFMVITIYTCSAYNISGTYETLLILSNVIILFSNIIVFYVHEETIKLNQKYTEMLLEQQKAEDNIEYYQILKEQYDGSRILIHDIKNHLCSITMLTDMQIDEMKNKLSEIKSSNGKNSLIDELNSIVLQQGNNLKDYIDGVYKDFEIKNSVTYCNHQLLNLITHRYFKLCSAAGINLDVNIQNTNLSFMSEHDITSLFDNLLENALEAAKNSTDKQIYFSGNLKLERFLVITIENSCDTPPRFSAGRMISHKTDKRLHGIGQRSIKRVVEKYSGNITSEYISESKKFTVVITFQLPDSNDKE